MAPRQLALLELLVRNRGRVVARTALLDGRVLPRVASSWHTPRVFRRILVLGMLPAASAALVAWWLIGDLSDAGGTRRMLAVPDGGTVVGLVGVVFAVIALALIVREGGAPGQARRVLVNGLLIGVWFALVLRVESARVSGANAGGALLLVLWPVVAVPLVAQAIGLLRRMR